MQPKVCILRTDGTNCDEETAHAFRLAGGSPHLVHVNDLRSGHRRLDDYQVLVIPGGFSYGDDIASGKVLAIELTAFFENELARFVNNSKLVLGICNGFQVLVRTGLLPIRTLGTMTATLATNTSSSFECRWIDLVTDRSPCLFTRGIGPEITLPVAHGEGRFSADGETMDWTERHNLVVFRYAENGHPTENYPANPNGSVNAIAGICDTTGRIFGLMPHPERFVMREQYPNWRRKEIEKPHGLAIFENAVSAASEL